MNRLVAAGLFAVAIVGLGCSDGKSGTGPPPVTYTISIIAPDSTVMHGRTSQLAATLTRSDGGPVAGGTIVWTSSDNNIASLDASGLLSANAPGSVTVTASANGASAHTAIRVYPSPHDNAPQIAAESVFVGQTIELRAYLQDPAFADGATWTSSDPTVGTVDGGVFTALKRGVSTVNATHGTKVGVVDVLAQTHVHALSLTPDTLVIPFLFSSAFDAVAVDADGKPIYGRTITWSVADSSRLRVDAGVLTPKMGGTTTVTAVCEGAMATAVVRVMPPLTYTAHLSAPRSFVTVGQTLQITSGEGDLSLFILPNDALVWSSSDSTIARVSATGLVTGVKRGKVTIIADAAEGGHKGTIDVNVEQPVASVVFAPDSVLLSIHGSMQLLPSLRDADGNTLTTRPPTWSSSDPNIVSVAPSPLFNLTGFRADARGTVGQATLTASVDGVVGTLKVIVTSGTDRMYFDYPSLGVGSYNRYDAQIFLLDANDQRISGRGVRLVSSDPGILSVSPDTATFVNGVVPLHVTTGHGGDVIVTATSGSLSANYIVHVGRVEVTVKLVTKPTVLPVGPTYRLTATAYQNDDAQHVIDWTTSDASVATVSDSGVVTPLAGGVVRIVVRARDAFGSSADSATIAIGAPLAPVVSAMSPNELVPGGSATITGQNFSTTPSANVVTIDGVPAQVTAATTTQLTIAVPGAASFPCRASHVAPLVVSTGPDLVTMSQQVLATATPRSIAISDAAFWSPAESRCDEIAKLHGVYLLTITNGGTSESATAGFSFKIDTGSVASTSVANRSPLQAPALARSLAPTVPRGAPASGVLRVNVDSVRRAAMAHRDLLERSRKLASKLGSPLPALRRARMNANANVVAAAAAVPDTGTRMFVRVPRIDTPDFCGDYRTIQARVVYTGAHAIILEDVQAPLAGMMDREYQDVGEEFDRTTYGVITSNFGDPMAMDQALGGPGRVTMVFTPAVNEMGPTGFVVSCDFYPATSAASSNQRAMFYAVVPTSIGIGFNGDFTRDVWRHFIRGTIAHETKHIASLAEHFARGAPQLEEGWLEEGTAMHAMELWARTVTRMTWKGNNNYASSLYCDVRPNWPTCNYQPYTMFDHFAYLHDFFRPTERHTPLGPTDPFDATFYGSAWWLVRWTVDQYATDESAFFRALTQESALTGTANLSARAGRPWGDLLRDWSLATLTAYQPPLLFPPHDPRLTIPSWNLRDVFDGMGGDFPSDFGGTVIEGHRQRCAEPATFVRALPPGGTSFYVLDTCESWKSFLRLQSDAGGAPSSALSIGLVRIQ